MASPLSLAGRYEPHRASAELGEPLLTSQREELDLEAEANATNHEDNVGQRAGAEQRASIVGAGAASLSSTVSTLCIGVLGTGQLALPYAVSLMGAGLGMSALALMGCVAVTTLYMLAECRQAAGSCNYGGILEKMLGPGFANLANILLALYAWGGGVTFMMILGKELQSVVQSTAGSVAPGLTPAGCLLAAVVLCVLPLSCCRQLDSLKFTSTLGACAALYITAVVVMNAVWPFVSSEGSGGQCHNALPPCQGPECHADSASTLEGRAELHLWPVLNLLERSSTGTAADFRLWPDIAELSWFHVLFNMTTGLAIFGFALNSQWCFVPLVAAMKDPTPRRTSAVIISSQSVVVLNYVLISFSGYFSFCDDTKDDILQNLDNSLAVVVARAMLVAQLCFALPVRFSVTRSIVTRLLFGHSLEASWHPGNSLPSHILLTTAVVGSAAATAAIATSISLAMSLASTICASAICYVFPAMSYLSLLDAPRRQQKTSPWSHPLEDTPAGGSFPPLPRCSLQAARRAVAYAILSYGLLLMVGGTAVNVIGALRGFVVIGGR